MPAHAQRWIGEAPRHHYYMAVIITTCHYYYTCVPGPHTSILVHMCPDILAHMCADMWSDRLGEAPRHYGQHQAYRLPAGAS